MRRVIIESPFAGAHEAEINTNLEYLFECAKDCLKRGESPFASHGFYTRFLDDSNPEERKQGIEAGLAWGQAAEASVVYIDCGISRGMLQGMKRALEEKRPIEIRSIFYKGKNNESNP